MAVEETPTDNRPYVAYSLGGWSKGRRRDIVGRTVEVAVAGTGDARAAAAAPAR